MTRGALVFIVSAACHNPDLARPDAAAEAATPAIAAAPVDAGTPPRCAILASPAPVPFGQGAELGEAVAVAGGFAVGMVRAENGKRTAAVARVGPGAPVVVDLGIAPRDALAPQPIARGNEVYAVMAATASAPLSSAAPRGASLALFHVAATAERLVEIPARGARPAAYDVVASAAADSKVGALVAWEDRDGRSRASDHEIVRVAALSPDLRAVHGVEVLHAAPDAGADAVDMGDPRVVVRDGGYWLTYVARRPEHASPHLPLPAGEIETPSEEATYGWIEALMLDADGAPKGTPRRLTSLTGHVVSYAAWSHDATLEVVAKDEGSGTLGGSLARVVFRGEGEPTSHVLVRAGVEEELPPVIVPSAGGSAWLSFLDVTGDTELLPMGPPAARPPLPTHEPLLAGARLLGAAEDGRRVALAAAVGSAWSLEWAACTE